MEMDTLKEMIREIMRLEDDTIQRFQDLNRRNGFQQILLEIEKLNQEISTLGEEKQIAERMNQQLNNHNAKVEKECQQLKNYNAKLQRNLDEEHAKRRESEHKQTRRINELEKINEDLRLEKRNLELDIDKQKKKASSGSERIRELIEENSRLKEDIREEQLAGQHRISELEKENLRQDKKIRDLNLEDEKRARTLQDSNDNIICIFERLREVQRDLNGLLERPRMQFLSEAPYDR